VKKLFENHNYTRFSFQIKRTEKQQKKNSSDKIKGKSREKGLNIYENFPFNR
jgi:hypothetical protein